MINRYCVHKDEMVDVSQSYFNLLEKLFTILKNLVEKENPALFEKYSKEAVLARIEYHNAELEQLQLKLNYNSPKKEKTPYKPYPEMTNQELLDQFEIWSKNCSEAAGWSSAYFSAKQLKTICAISQQRGLNFTNPFPIIYGVTHRYQSQTKKDPTNGQIQS